jgi:hypothetical protein
MSKLVVPDSRMNVDCSSKAINIASRWKDGGGWLTDMDFELSVCTTTFSVALGLAAIILG